MDENDPSERFLRSHLTPIADTPERSYLLDESNDILVASWKPGRAEVYNADAFQRNALLLADLIKARRPQYVMVDCRHLGFEVSYQDHVWYVNQTRALWEKSKIKKIAFVFKDNLAVQMSMEGLRDVAQEEGLVTFEHRIFEGTVDAANWLKGSK